MNNNPLVNSANSSAKTSGLKPALATVLGSLEVQLDQELARYRRTRIGSRVPNQPRLQNIITNQPQDVTDTKSIETDVQLPDFTTPPSPVAQTQETEARVTEVEATTNTPTQTEVTSSKIVPATPKEDNLEKTADTKNNNNPPDDYLESSEALLRSLTEEQETATTQKPTQNKDFLLSPLGIGLMLLLIVGSLALGYGFSNPKSLPQFSLTKLFKRSSPSAENTQVSAGNATTVSQPEITPLNKYPNLASQEFPEVKDLNDVVSLTPKAKPTPTTPPQPPAVPNTSTSTTTTTAVTPPPAPKPPVPAATTAPKPTTPPPQADAEIKPSADGFYYVVADNQNPNLLAKAKQIVPDAYLSPNKKYIYLGAIQDRDKAQQLVKQLQAKGIEARIGQR